MAQPKRHDPSPSAPPSASPGAMPWGDRTPREGDYAVGGHVGQMHADLAERLAREGIAPAAPQDRGERAIRLLSVAGGFGALAAAYAAVAYAIFH